jgi:glycosyltransferase involved in cell wall biosynthesis
MKEACNADVTVIIASLNEKKGIGPTLLELRRVLEFPFCLVVDGNSVDGTGELAEELGAKSVVQNGKGKGHAIAQALKHVPLGTRYIVLTDADYTYPATYVPEMIEILEDNPGVGMVTGNRFNGSFDSNAMDNTHYMGNKFLAFMQHMLNGVKMQDPLTGLRVARWELLKNWEPKSISFDIEVELNYYIERKGYQVKEIPIHYRERLGKKKLKFRHGVTILKRIIMERFND